MEMEGLLNKEQGATTEEMKVPEEAEFVKNLLSIEKLDLHDLFGPLMERFNPKEIFVDTFGITEMPSSEECSEDRQSKKRKLEEEEEDSSSSSDSDDSDAEIEFWDQNKIILEKNKLLQEKQKFKAKKEKFKEEKKNFELLKSQFEAEKQAFELQKNLQAQSSISFPPTSLPSSSVPVTTTNSVASSVIDKRGFELVDVEKEMNQRAQSLTAVAVELEDMILGIEWNQHKMSSLNVLENAKSDGTLYATDFANFVAQFAEGPYGMNRYKGKVVMNNGVPVVRWTSTKSFECAPPSDDEEELFYIGFSSTRKIYDKNSQNYCGRRLHSVKDRTDFLYECKKTKSGDILRHKVYKSGQQKKSLYYMVCFVKCLQKNR